MTAFRVFVLLLSSMLIGFMLVMMFGVLLPAMISGKTAEMILLGFFLMFLLISAIGMLSYRFVITLKELLK